MIHPDMMWFYSGALKILFGLLALIYLGRCSYYLGHILKEIKAKKN